MKNILSTLALAASQVVFAQPNPTQIVDMLKVPLCSEVQRKVDTALSDEQIISRLSDYIPNLKDTAFKDDAVRLFRLSLETTQEECIMLPKDFPGISPRYFLLITSIAWGVGSEEFYRGLVTNDNGSKVEIMLPRK